MSKQQEMLVNIGLWLAKLISETNADELRTTVSGVTNSDGEKLGDFELVFKKKQLFVKENL